MDCSGAHLSASSTIPTRQAIAFPFLVAGRFGIPSPRARTPAIVAATSSRPQSLSHGDGSTRNLPPKPMAHQSMLAVEGLGLEDSVEVANNGYSEKLNQLIRMADGGPPRWFSPLECGSRSDGSPLLLYLPGIIGVGTGLSMQHNTLGKIFDIWCLHVPFTDKTSFRGLVHIVERTVRSECKQSPNRPIFVVGECVGACVALAVAARNPGINLILVLANPATSFDHSRLKHLLHLCVEAIPDQLSVGFTRLIQFLAGDTLTLPEVVHRRNCIPKFLSGERREDVVATYSSAVATIFSKETLRWKLEVLESASAYANARLRCVKAKTLVLASGRDQLLPSEDEAKRLHKAMPRCDIRVFPGSGHHLLLERGFDLATIIKGTSLYQRGPSHDYVSDYVPPTPEEFKDIYDAAMALMLYTSPVLLSKLKDGRVVRGMGGVPREGPVLYVGYHMLLGLDVIAMLPQVMYEEKMVIRTLSHPLTFDRKKDGLLPPVSSFDIGRQLGVVPVNEANLYKLMAAKAHALLYPGGIREACHRKGEEYVLHWPDNPEFVRMAARFGATIVPLGTVGEDDLFEIVLDYDDQMKIPILKDVAKSITEETVRLSRGGETGGEVAKQEMHYPITKPKLPGRFYYLFGNPIETKGREKELLDKEKAAEVYSQVKTEVEDCITFLKEKRQSDPYRSLTTRLAYAALHGPYSQIPTFDLE